MSQYLIFSDIDNTLLQSYIIKDGEIYHIEEYGEEIKEIVQKLRKNNIPLILCSSKTRFEQEKIRKYLEIHDPYVVENGGAIFIPENYFPIDLEELGLSIRRIDENLVIELGKSYNRIIETLQEIREIFHIEFIAVHDLSLPELAQKVGISINDAKLMASREYSETILEININKLDKLKKILNDRGLRILQGTRYNTVSSLHDKGSAISILKKLYSIKYEQKKIESIGIGDAFNDIPMFENVDKPFLVRNIQNSYAPMKINNLIRVNGIGQTGWKETILNYILKK
jgi:mannosyl-3-phosphoglycerate phosphatase